MALLAYHFGPGQAGLAREEAKTSIQAALDFEASEQWQQAIDSYNDALAALPDSETAQRQQLQLARANARIYVGELPEAMLAMEHLLDETAKGSDKALEKKVRSRLGTLMAIPKGLGHKPANLNMWPQFHLGHLTIVIKQMHIELLLHRRWQLVQLPHERLL